MLGFEDDVPDVPEILAVRLEREGPIAHDLDPVFVVEVGGCGRARCLRPREPTRGQWCTKGRRTAGGLVVMRVVLAPVAVVLAATLAPAVALGKGENGAISQAMIEGPGLADQISLPGGDGSGDAGWTGMQQLGQLTESAFFPAAFVPRVSTNYGQYADTRLREKPKGELGPRYTITYVVRGPNGTSGRILQDVYPYAKLMPVPYLVRGQVVTYMKPGQRAVGSKPTVGGWYVATTFLKDVLVAAGLPETPPSGDESSGRPWELIGAVGGIGIVLALGALLIRLHGQRRTVTA